MGDDRIDWTDLSEERRLEVSGLTQHDCSDREG
jgi:hypothetical protein